MLKGEKMKHCLLFFFCILPFSLCAQTWQKAVQTVTRQAKRPGVYAGFKSDAARLKTLQQAFQKTDILNTWLDGVYAPENVYTILETNKALDAWAARSNHLLAAQRIVQERNLRRLEEHKKEVLASMALVEQKSPSLYVPRMEGKQNIFLGEEYHLVPALKQMLVVVKDFLQRYPDKKIVLFTQFLPDSGLKPAQYFPEGGNYEEYFPAFQSLKAQGVDIVGLEEPAAKGHWYEKNGLLVRGADTAYGRYVRHLHWAKRIKAWREKYPQAIFFIYTGAEHCSYNMPHALPLMVGGSNHYVALLQSRVSVKKNLFHRWSNFQFAKPGVLYTRDKKWSQVIGFDEQLIFP